MEGVCAEGLICRSIHVMSCHVMSCYEIIDVTVIVSHRVSSPFV